MIMMATKTMIPGDDQIDANGKGHDVHPAQDDDKGDAGAAHETTGRS